MKALSRWSLETSKTCLRKSKSLRNWSPTRCWLFCGFYGDHYKAVRVVCAFCSFFSPEPLLPRQTTPTSLADMTALCVCDGDVPSDVSDVLPRDQCASVRPSAHWLRDNGCSESCQISEMSSFNAVLNFFLEFLTKILKGTTYFKISVSNICGIVTLRQFHDCEVVVVHC